MRVRVRARGLVRLLVLCGLIAEMALIPGVTAGRPAIAQAAGVRTPRRMPAPSPVRSGAGAATPARAALSAARTRAAYGALPLAFEENRGQSAAAARFLVRGQGYRLFLTPGALVLALAAPVLPRVPRHPRGGHLPAPATTVRGTVLRLSFLGATRRPRLEGVAPLAGTVSYLHGSDQARWRTGVPTYGRVVYHDLYPGIDLTYDGTQEQLEDTYTIAPGADPSAISLGVAGATAVRLDGDRLALDTAQGPVVEQAPVAYQEIGGQRQDVPARYTLDGAGRVGFALGAYDQRRPLVIDPVLAYSTYLGGSVDDEGNAIAVDAQGNAYVAGETSSPDYPTTTGAYSTTLAGQFDAFVTKLNPQGTARLWSTYLGGAAYDIAYAVAADVSGTVYLAGETASADFPLRHAYQTTHGAATFNAFVTRLAADGRTLLYSSLLGGSVMDFAHGIAVDGVGHADVAGLTQSPDFPTTASAYQRTIGGANCPYSQFSFNPPPCQDAFVAAFDTNASGAASLPYSSFFGGVGNDNAEGLARDGAGRVYVTGTENSTNFPTKGGLATQAGTAYVAAFDPTRSGTASLVYSTRLGGDNGHAVAADTRGDVYVAGSTSAANAPTTPGAAQPAPGGGLDAYVLTLNPAGNAVVYGTYLGGSSSDSAYGIALDPAGDAYVTGSTLSSDFPTMANAPQRMYGGGQSSYGDVFVTELSPAGTARVYSTYLGGSGDEYGRGIAVDSAGSAYVTGPTNSPNYPTSSPLQGSFAGPSYDAFVTKLLAPRSGDIPWHPHQRINVGGAFDVAIDLADGHADISTHDLAIPGRGPDLVVDRTWDSVLAQTGSASSAGQGIQSSLTPSMGGALQGTVVYTDGSGAVWPFVYTGSLSAPPPYTSYQGPAGEPWQLTRATTGYTLTNFLTSEMWTFDASGRLLADTDSYGNANSLSYGAGSARSPSSAANSGDRSLAFSYSGGLITDAQSPLWQSGGATTPASQHVTYGYNGSGQLTSVTRGAGTGDALGATLGYSGTQVVTLTTPANRVWQLGYDAAGRVVRVTSPVSGTQGQPGYTPAYTTQLTYGAGQTQVVAGGGTSGALTTTYTLDNQGEPITTTDGLGHSSGASYDADHNVLTSTDANNNTTTNKYQYIGPNGYSGPLGPAAPIGQVIEEDQPAIQPYVPGNTLTVTPVVTHSYDATTHDLVATKLPEGGLTTYSYDGHHSVVGTAEQTTCAGCAASWQGTINGYDAYGERTSATDGRGVNATNGVVTPNGQASAYTSHMGYDTQGDLTSESTPPITVTLGGVTTTASAVTTSYTYDGDGNRQTQVSANGNASGAPRSYTTSYGYDHLGRQTTTTVPAITLYNNTTTQPVQTTGYDAEGNVARTTDALGAVTTSSYDPEGRQVSMTNPVSGTSLMTYTASELAAQQDPQGNVTGYGYDAAGRQVQTTNPATGTIQTAYDAAGNTLALTTTDRTNGNAVVTLDQMGYDAQNRVITATVVTNTANVAGSALTTLTAYDQDGNVAQTRQPNGDVVYNAYDAADRLTNVEIDPALLTKAQAATHPSYEAYGYDAAGNQTVAVDADNRLTTSQYDGDNRAVQSVAASTAPTGTTTITTTTGYDPDGNTLRQTSQTVDSTSPGAVQTHAITSAYNPADWETSTSDDGYTTTYGYDAAGQQRSETIVDGTTPVTMQLDAEGRVTSIGESYGGAGPYTSQYAYNADDLPTTITLPGGVTESAGYDANSALTRLTVSGPNTGVTTTTLATAYGYGYNAAGWTTSTTTISGTDAIAHDGAGRLTSDCGPQVEVRNTGDHCYRWTYDANGNVTSQVADNGATEVYAYSPTQPNEVTQATFQQANVPASDRYKNTDTYYGYDGNGDTTAITSPVNGAYTDTAAINDHLVYDAEQRPITLTHLEGGVPITISLGYNADGLRSRYTVVMSGTVVNDERFQYRDGELAQVSAVTATLNANGSVKSQGLPYTDTFIYGPSGEPLEFLRQQNGQTNRYWYALDGQGSVVAVTDASGKVVDRYNYDSWGEQIGRYPETVPQQLRYAGYWYDSEMQWYWLTTRYYNPEDLRFLQPDPSDLDGVHTYAYVGDDPVDSTDPDGMKDLPGCETYTNFSWCRKTTGGSSTLDPALQGIYAFVIGDDVNTLAHGSTGQKLFVIASWLPWGKAFKVFKVVGDGFRVVKVGVKDRRLLYASLEAVERGSPVGKRGVRVIRQSVIDREIAGALVSGNAGTALEGKVASYLRQGGVDVLRFRRQFGQGGSIGEIDVETPEAIIEVYSGKKTSKLESVQSKQDSRIMNPTGKPVILYAPGYRVNAANEIWNAGAIVVKDFESLSAALHYLRTGHLPPGHE